MCQVLWLFLLPLFIRAKPQISLLSDCFTYFPNVGMVCASAFEHHTSTNEEDCADLCLSDSIRCLTAEYDTHSKECSLYDAAVSLQEPADELAPIRPIPLSEKASFTPVTGGVAWKKRRRVRRSQRAATGSAAFVHSAGPTPNEQQEEMEGFILANTTECIPSVKPTIGTLLLVPKKTCGGRKAESSRPRQAAPGGFRAPPPLPVNLPPTLGVIQDCDDPTARTHVGLIDGVRVDKAPAFAFEANRFGDCLGACQTNAVCRFAREKSVQFPDGGPFPMVCLSAHYEKKTRGCAIFNDALNPNGGLQYSPDQAASYMEKLCIPENELPVSCADAFQRIPQHVLFGHASDIQSTTSQLECLRKCLRAPVELGLDCRSIVHFSEFPVDNCILNVHTRVSRREYFTAETRQKVDYIELPLCAKTRLKSSSVDGELRDSSVSTVSSFSSRRHTEPATHGVVLASTPASPFDASAGLAEQWSPWSMCDLATSTKSRYRSCLNCNPTRESAPCFAGEEFNNLLTNFLKEQDKTESGQRFLELDQPGKAPGLVPFLDRKLVNGVPAVEPKPRREFVKGDVEFFGPPFGDDEEEAVEDEKHDNLVQSITMKESKNAKRHH